MSNSYEPIDTTGQSATTIPTVTMTVPTKSYISVAILFVINLLNYMDRFTVAGVLSKIESYYSLSHGQSGLLQTSFIVCYMIFAPLFGYLGDRYSRKLIMIFGILFWSVTTFIGSFVPQNWTPMFFLLRALVGVGEASYSTIAPTIIADLFAPVMRSKMLAIFYFAIPVGSGLGYIVGTGVAGITGNWKDALRVTPVLGIVCTAMIYFFVREPKRGESEGITEQCEQTKVMDDIRYLLTVPSYLWSTVGFTCVCFAVGALSWWAPTFMAYAYTADKNPKSDGWIGLIFGVIACIGGILGVVMGAGGSQYYKRFNPRADPLVCAIGALAAVPPIFITITFAHSSQAAAFFFVFVSITLLSTNWSLVADMLLYVITPNRRSFAQSLQILVSHLFGDASSPFVIGLLMDTFKNPKWDTPEFWSLQYALYLTPFVIVLGGLAFLYTSLYIVVDKDKCKIQIQVDRSRSPSDTSIHSLPSCASNTRPYNTGIDDNSTIVDPDVKYLMSQ
ncbi:protein spinster homolog 3-like [Oppia nitens]|uniref:protein spinster homolog 3-like n=1 Tax=Oppia nitens TaxID=1686743 RepID=UPI0023DC6A35|nr:protein spinster homolog 3-like [Oppia nitens]